MSAALVESVREASQAQMRRASAQKASTSGDLHGMIAYEHQQLYALDLPAILAALTEAEALRAQVAASQARGVALREAGEGLLRLVNDPYDKNTWSANSEKAWNALRAALSTPTDTAALRAFGERVFDATLEATRSHCACDAEKSWSRSAIVDRVLGGS